jgi:hypothetical protein
MDYTQLAEDLRQRINPAYAAQLGTESSERRLCAEAIEALQARVTILELDRIGADRDIRGLDDLATKVKAERDSALAKLTAQAQPLTDDFVRKVIRLVQPDLADDSEAWADEFDECKYWLKAAHKIGHTEFIAGAQAQPLTEPDLFWNDDDPEKPYSSIDEFLNHEICNGNDLEVGHTRTIQRAIRLPNIEIRITAVHDEECEADYEVIEKPQGGSV